MLKYCIKLLLIIGLVTSCTKDGKNITVQGRVLNPVTGEGIANVEIRLLKETSGSPGNSGGYKAVESVYSDANGSFELNHTSWFPRLVACYPDENIYYNLGWAENGTFLDTYFEKVKLGRFTNLDYWAVPYGNLVYHIRNDNCQGPNDALTLFYDGSQVGSDDGLIGELTGQLGCVDISGNPIQYPMGERYYHWTVTRNGVSQTFYQTVYVPANGTTTLEVFY